MNKKIANKFSDDAKEILKNVESFCTLEKKEGLLYDLNKSTERMAAMTGVSVSSFRRVCRPKPRVDQDACTPKTSIDLDDFDKAVLRRTIQTMYTHQKMLPTLNNILAALKESIGYSGSRESLRKQLKQIGFTYRKCRTNRKVLMERPDVTYQRMTYLRRIKQLRTQRYYIVYTDETYVHSCHTVPKCWAAEGIEHKVPFSKGQRMIVLHAGGTNGFIPGAELVFKAHSASGDYHDEMNSRNFTKWLEEKLIPNLPARSAVVMDNASYHNVQVDKAPTMATRKADIISWLQRHDVQCGTDMLKSELLAIVKQRQSKPVYAVDELLSRHGHLAVRLPPYHADLNPIELIWANLKGFIARRNVAFRMEKVKSLIDEGLNSITASDWQRCIFHVQDIERTYWESDIAIDDIIENFIIDLTSDTDDNEADSSETDTASEGEN